MSREPGDVAGGLAQASRDDVIERSIAHFSAADTDYGQRVAAAVAALRKRPARYALEPEGPGTRVHHRNGRRSGSQAG